MPGCLNCGAFNPSHTRRCWKCGKEPFMPRVYEDNECMHSRRFDRHGKLYCQDCGAVYDERTLEWVMPT